MSTYTDLHIRTKENITILRMPGNKYDGMTPQRVIFANPENIYYGTFQGDLKALSTDFTKVMLNDCSVINGMISGTTLYSINGQEFPVQFFIDSLSAFDALSTFAELSTLSSISSDLSSALTAFKADFSDFQTSVETSCSLLCASLSSLSGQVASIGQSSIDGLSAVSAYIQNEVSGLKESTQSFQESVEASCDGLCIELSGTQADVQDVIGQLEQLSADVNPRLSGLADGIERNLSNISTISDEVSSINNSISDMHEDISALSDELSTISNDFLKYKEDSSLSIDHLAQRMTNGLMYKQSLVIDNDNADGTLSGLFRINDFESSYPLSAGYFYIAKIAKHEDIQKKYSYSGVEVGFGDWLIVNNGCTVGTITSNDIDVLDGQDYDNFKLSDDNEAYGSNTFNGPTTFNSNVQFNDSVEASSIAASQVSAGCISVSNWEHIYSNQQTLADALDSKISSISAEYNAISNHIHLSANGIIVGDIDCEAFTKDGMLTDVQLLDDELVFSFNSAASSDSISIALSNFIDKSQYYTSSQTSSDIQLSNAFSRMQNWVIEQNYAPLSDIHGDYIEDVNGNKINADRSCIDVVPLAETVWHIEEDITTPFVSHYEGNATYNDGVWSYTDSFGNTIHVGCKRDRFHQIAGWYIQGTITFVEPTIHVAWQKQVDFNVDGDKFTESIEHDNITLTRTVKTNSKLATESQLPTKTSDLTNDSGFITAAQVPTPSYIEDSDGNKIEADRDFTQVDIATSWVIDDGVSEHYLSGSKNNATEPRPENPQDGAVRYALDYGYVTPDMWTLNVYTYSASSGIWDITMETSDASEEATELEFIGGITATWQKATTTTGKLATEEQVAQKQDQLSEEQMATLDAEVERRETIVKLQGNITKTFYWTGTVTKQTLADAELYDQTQQTFAAITEIEFGTGAEILDQDLFNGCQTLEKVKFPSSLVEVKKNAFKNCANIWSITFPKCYTNKEGGKWGIGIFENCANLATVEIPASMKSIPLRMFFGCANLSNVTISSGVEEIGNGAFARIDQFGYLQLYIPSSVKRIGTMAFANSNIPSVVLNEGLEVVLGDAFNGCTNIQEITVPSTSQLRNNVFDGCTSLQKIVFKGKSLHDLTEDTFWPFGLTTAQQALVEVFNDRIVDGNGNIIRADRTCKSGATWNWFISGTNHMIGTKTDSYCINEEETQKYVLQYSGSPLRWTCSIYTKNGDDWVLQNSELIDRDDYTNYLCFSTLSMDMAWIPSGEDEVLATQEWVSQNYRELSNRIYIKPAESPDWTDKWIILDGEYSQYRNIILTAFVDPIWTEDDDMYGWRYIAPGGILNDTVITLLHDATNDKWSFKISDGTITPVETVSADGDFNENWLAFEGGWMLERCAIADKLALENDISKVFIKNPDDLMLSSGAQSNLSVIKLTNEEYATILLNDEAQPNALYVVSSDNINAYGQKIENLAEPELSTDAATKGYVDNAGSSISGQLSGLISTMYDDLEHIATDSIISSLEQKSCISNVICAVVGIKDTLISLRQTLSGMLGL